MLVAIAQNTIDGLMVGSGYALLALGFALPLRLTGHFNLAQAAGLMLGAVAASLLHRITGSPAAVAVLGGVAVAAAIGLYAERICLGWPRRRWPPASIVAAAAIWLQLEAVIGLLLPRGTAPFPALASDGIHAVGPLLLRLDLALVAAVAAVMIAAIAWVLRRSHLGLALRAAAQSPGIARHLGIDLGRLARASFLAAAVLGGLGGCLLAATDQQVTSMLAASAALKACAAMLLGGLGSIPGAVLGGLALGMLESHGERLLGPGRGDLVVLALVFGTLLLRALLTRPAGLGRAERA